MISIAQDMHATEVGVRRVVIPDTAAGPHDDDRWVERLRCRDPEAFRDLLRRETPRVYSLASRMMPRGEEVEDLVQEVFIEVWRSLPSFRGHASVRTWVHRVALNTCANRLRRQRPEEPSLDEAFPDPDGAPCPTSVEQDVLQSDLRQRVAGALDGLPAQFRQVIVLHELEGLTYREVARLLGIPVGTVKSRLFHALRKLRERLEPYILSLENPGAEQVTAS